MAYSGAKVRTLRQQHGWSLDELAQRARVNKGTIHRIEKGESENPRGQTMRRIAAAFQVKLRDFLDDDADGVDSGTVGATIPPHTTSTEGEIIGMLAPEELTLIGLYRTARDHGPEARKRFMDAAFAAMKEDAPSSPKSRRRSGGES